MQKKLISTIMTINIPYTKQVLSIILTKISTYFMYSEHNTQQIRVKSTR